MLLSHIYTNSIFCRVKRKLSMCHETYEHESGPQDIVNADNATLHPGEAVP